MEDSLEYYLNIIKNIDTDNNSATLKNHLITAQRKKECESKAMKVVEFLIEGKLHPEIFLKCLPFINQNYYQDIVVERAITNLCGYALCGGTLKNIPKKKYYISTINNKIYDITDRKNYCSNFCYTASIYIKNQIDNSPLWLRKSEDIKEYKLLPKSERGLPGELLDQGMVVSSSIDPEFISVSVFTELSLNDINVNEFGINEDKKKKKTFKSTLKNVNVMKTIDEITDEDNNFKQQYKKNEECIEVKPIYKKPDNKLDKIQRDQQLENEIKSNLCEWLTIESFIFLHGEDKIKEIIKKKKILYYYDSSNLDQIQTKYQENYLKLCKKLNLQELFNNNSQTLNKIPNYKQIKIENKCLDRKVKSFYNGTSYVDSNLSNSNSINNNSSTEDNSLENNEIPSIIPLGDINCKTSLRRNIFFNSLNKKFEIILYNLKMTPIEVLPDIKKLIKTFNLKPNNIILKPVLGNFIVLILLKMLTIRDKHIENILNEEYSIKYLNTYINQLPSKEKFFDDIYLIFNDFEKFIDDMITRTE